jgi:hypothetical protein
MKTNDHRVDVEVVLGRDKDGRGFTLFMVCRRKRRTAPPDALDHGLFADFINADAEQFTATYGPIGIRERFFDHSGRLRVGERYRAWNEEQHLLATAVNIWIDHRLRRTRRQQEQMERLADLILLTTDRLCEKRRPPQRGRMRGWTELRARGLLGEMWLQFACAVSDRDRLQRCTRCGRCRLVLQRHRRNDPVHPVCRPKLEAREEG